MFAISKESQLQGNITIPGSKSHTIRAILLAAMAEGKSLIHNPLTSNDCLSALKAVRDFGVEVVEKPGMWIVQGKGRDLRVPENYIDTGNSGTTTYFVASMAALCEGYTFITGDSQIRRRPIQPLVEALNELGANTYITRPGAVAPPIVVKGKIRGGKVNFSGFNSQYISSLLLISPLAEGKTEITVDNPLEKPYLQMTIDWMKRYGVELSKTDGNYKYFAVDGGQKYIATETTVPSDWSGAAFPLVAAVVTQSDVVINGIDFDDSQGDKEVVDILISMGANIIKDSTNHRMIIKGGNTLHSELTINLNDIPDSLPILSVAACYAQGDTKFVGLAHVRVKETDRVAVMEEELIKLGADIETGPDYMIVHGGKILTGTDVDSHDDHRVAMALTVAGLFSKGEMKVKDAECASVSYPKFFEIMNSIGGNIGLID
jgi:3-phosphoshikimate 1-carboxyvinyltransferase